MADRSCPSCGRKLGQTYYHYLGFEGVGVVLILNVEMLKLIKGIWEPQVLVSLHGLEGLGLKVFRGLGLRDSAEWPLERGLCSF